MITILNVFLLLAVNAVLATLVVSLTKPVNTISNASWIGRKIQQLRLFLLIPPFGYVAFLGVAVIFVRVAAEHWWETYNEA